MESEFDIPILAIAAAIAVVRALPKARSRRFLWSDIYEADHYVATMLGLKQVYPGRYAPEAFTLRRRARPALQSWPFQEPLASLVRQPRRLHSFN